MTTQMKPLTAASSPWVASISVTEGFKVSSLSSKEDWAPALFPRSWPIRSAGGDNTQQTLDQCVDWPQGEGREQLQHERSSSGHSNNCMALSFTRFSASHRIIRYL